MNKLIKLFFKIIACHSLCFCLSAFAFAQGEFKSQPLKIIWNVADSRKDMKGKKAQTKLQTGFKTGCEALGQALLVGKGPWGFGAFSAFSCYRDSELVAGQAQDTDWSLLVVDGEKAVSLTLKHGNQVVAELPLPASNFTFDCFADAEFVDLLAYTLLDAMPMGMQVTKAMLTGKPPAFSGRHWRSGKARTFKYEVPKPPDKLILYRLSWNVKGQRWVSAVKDEAQLLRVEKPSLQKSDKHQVLAGGLVVYEASPQLLAALGKGPLWAQAVTGPGSRRQELQAIVNDAHAQLAAAASDGDFEDFLRDGGGGIGNFLRETSASGYAGIRYGLQVLPGDKIISKTSFLGLLLEVRGGAVKGLRYYFDKVPRVTEKETLASGDEGETYVESSRHVFGYSFGINPGYVVDRITLDPKLGIWNFNAALPADFDGYGRPQQIVDFKLGQTISVAVEVGAEILSDWYTLRGWLAHDTGYSLLKKGGKVNSSRFGLDAYFTAGPRFLLLGMPVKTALLGFYVYESVNLVNGNKDPPEAGAIKITEVPYTAGYAGVGVALSW